MANWSNPTLTSLYTDFVTEVKNRDVDLALGLDPATTSPTNVPTNAIRWNSASFKYQKWDGSTWNDLSTKYIFTAVEVSGATVPTNGMYLSTTNTLNFSTASTASRLTIDGNGNVNIDSGTFYVDAVNNRVGVGTTGPTGVFEACGSSSYFRPAGAAGTFLQITAGAANGDVTLTASANSGGYPPLVFNVGGSTRATLDASGNLGLGVVPSAWNTLTAFQLPGGSISTFSTYQNFLSSNAYYAGSWKYVSATTAGQYLQDGNIHKWYISTNTPSAGAAITFTQAMTLDASGRLGVGTDTPGTRLEAYTTDGSGLRTSPVNVATISAAGPSTNYAYNGFGPGLVFKAANYTTPTPVTAARIRSSLNDNSVETYGSSIIFDVTATRGGSLYQAMEVNYAGNLGLGVVPSAWNTLKAMQISNSGFAGTTTQTFVSANAFYQTGWKYVGADAASMYQQDSSHKWFISTNTPSVGGAITFTQAMTLDASGNLGIGATSSLSPITVERSGSISAEIKLNQTGTSGRDYRIASTGSGYGSAGNLIFYDATAGAERARIDSSGYMQGTVNGLGAGRIPAKQYYRLNSGRNGVNQAAAQSVFGVGVTLVGSTVYEFEGLYYLQCSNVTGSSTMSFLFGGTATLNNIMYSGVGPGFTAVLPPATFYDPSPASFITNTASASTVTGVLTSAVSVIYLIKGTVSVNAGGTFIPQYSFDNAPGNLFTTNTGSYFSIWPLGASGSNTSIGTWA